MLLDHTTLTSGLTARVISVGCQENRPTDNGRVEDYSKHNQDHASEHVNGVNDGLLTAGGLGSPHNHNGEC